MTSNTWELSTLLRRDISRPVKVRLGSLPKVYDSFNLKLAIFNSSVLSVLLYEVRQFAFRIPDHGQRRDRERAYKDYVTRSVYSPHSPPNEAEISRLDFKA